MNKRLGCHNTQQEKKTTSKKQKRQEEEEEEYRFLLDEAFRQDNALRRRKLSRENKSTPSPTECGDFFLSVRCLLTFCKFF